MTHRPVLSGFQAFRAEEFDCGLAFSRFYLFNCVIWEYALSLSFSHEWRSRRRNSRFHFCAVLVLLSQLVAIYYYPFWWFPLSRHYRLRSSSLPQLSDLILKYRLMLMDRLLYQTLACQRSQVNMLYCYVELLLL